MHTVFLSSRHGDAPPVSKGIWRGKWSRKQGRLWLKRQKGQGLTVMLAAFPSSSNSCKAMCLLYCSLQQAPWAISPPMVACCCEEWLSLSASVATPHGGYDLVPIQITDWKSHAGLVSNSTWMLDVYQI